MLIDPRDSRSFNSKTTDAIAKETARFEAKFCSSTNRTILLIGGSGYIGCPVTAHLLAHGARVRNLDCHVYNNGGSIASFLLHPRYEFLAGSMGDRQVLTRALDGVTDVVILAGLVGDPITKAFPKESGRINDDEMRICIDTLAGKGLNKVAFISTCSNYGMLDEGQIATEDYELKPLSLYAKSKVAAEKYLLSLRGEVDYAPTILRFATAFGLAPRMRFDLTVNEFTRELYCDNKLLVFDAHTWRPYCHVQDFARLIARVLEFPVETVGFEVFNAGGDENNHTKQSLVDLITAKLPNRSVAYRENSDDPRNYRVSFEKVRELLDFTPRMSVSDGINEIIWALSARMLDDVDVRRDYYGNYDLPGLSK